ncbi:MAG: GGDEF domain-containing protein [Denitromonas halophila]|nr:MAG: GGDEF domain-containing protein [Denitromonas halophila]TVT70513.1 MAG: GGDEF domain-containing protein [Denitromonas halophila]
MTTSDMDSSATPMDAAVREDDVAFRVIDFLFVHRLSTTPVHYAVVHAYFDGKHQEICAAVDGQLAAGKPLDAFFVGELYEEYLAAEAIRRFRGVGSDVERLLDGLMDSLRTADQGSLEYQASLQENIGKVGQSSDALHLKQVAQSLLESALKASETNDVLKKNLETADQEARQLRSELEKHRRETMTDPLTGLLNRRGMEVEMSRVLGEDVEGQAAMLVLDIDHFKRINDTYGHAVGDVVIRKVAQTVKRLIPTGAVPVRYGGEEFAVLLPRSSSDEAKGIAESIRETIEKLRLIRRHDKMAISQFTISIGIAKRSLRDDMETLFQRADKALYEAKSGGRNRVMLAA